VYKRQFQYLLLVSVVLFPGVLIGEALVATEHQGANLLLSVATLPVLLALLAAWIPDGRATGASAALLTFYGIQVASALVVAERLLDAGLVEAKLLASAVLTVGFVGLAFVIEHYQPLVTIPLGTLSFAVLVLFHRATLARLIEALIPTYGSRIRPQAPRLGS